MKFIKFGKLDKKILIPIIAGILRLIILLTYLKNPKYDILTKNPFVTSIYTSIGMISAIIPCFIIKHRSKQINNISIELQNQSKLNLELIHTPILEEIQYSCKKYKLILYQEIFDFLQTILATIFNMDNVYSLWTFDIIFMSIFSYLLLKSKLYRHQYVSMAIIMILGLLLNVIEYYKLLNDDDKFNFSRIMMSLLSEIFLSLIIVIAKYNMEKTYCSPYEICAWNGSIGLILYIIVLLIINKLELTIDGSQYPDNFFELFDNYDVYDFLLCISIIASSAIFNMSLLVTCNYFTPYHIIIIQIFREFYNSLDSDNNTILNILSFFILALITFMFLVFIEIIELNIFNISYNTKRNIQSRSFDDSLRKMETITNPAEEILAEGDE